MRQYRGLTKDGKWVYGWYFELDGMSFIENQAEKSNNRCTIEVIPETIVQQIGLQDKNKEEIYAGDKLKSGKRILTVMWDGENMQWKAKEDGYHYLTPLCQWAISEQFEIIHPKLLEKPK